MTEVEIPQVETFKTAIGERRVRRALLIRWIEQGGGWGIGECACRPDPFYNGEYVDGAFQVVEDFIGPLLSKDGTINETLTTLSRLRGWPFTTAAVSDAIFDLLRRKKSPDPLDAWGPTLLERVPAGIALGLFDNEHTAAERAIAAASEGYRRLKLKVAPWINPRVLEAIRNALPEIPLSLDANGSLDPNDLDFIRRLTALNPIWIEQPFPPARLDLHADFRREHPELKVCLDESIQSLGDLVSAHRLGAIDVVNLKPGRVGGMLESIRVLEYCRHEQLPVWIGGMFETGIGRRLNLRYAARMSPELAHDLSPSQRYYPRDLATDPVEMDANGFVPVDDERPVELDEEFIDAQTVRRSELSR